MNERWWLGAVILAGAVYGLAWWALDGQAREADARAQARRDSVVSVRAQRHALDSVRLVGWADSVVNARGDSLRALLASTAARVVVREMHHCGRSYWAWTPAEWLAILCPSIAAFARRHHTTAACRASLIAVAYLLGGVGSLAEFQVLGPAERTSLARKVFGGAAVAAAADLAAVDVLARRWPAQRHGDPAPLLAAAAPLKPKPPPPAPPREG